MPMCSVKSCGNASKKKTVDRSIKYFSFPRDPDICAEWIRATSKETLNVKNARICSVHFEPDCFKEDWRAEAYGSEFVPKSGARLIKTDAIPTLFLGPESNDEQSLKAEALYDDAELTEEFSPEPVDQQDSLNYMEHEPDEHTPGGEIHMLRSETPSKEFLKAENEQLTQEVERLQKELDESKQELDDQTKILQQHNDELRKAVQDSHQSIIELLSNVFTPGQIKQLLNPNLKHVKWSDEDVSAAIALRNVSVEAYEYLRNKRKLPLPGLSTLRRWVSEADFDEGILKSVMTHMNMKSREMSEHEKLIILSFDELYLSTRGESEQKKRTVTAIARGLFGKWQTPVYYEYDKSMEPQTLLRIIDCLYANGFIVVSVVCDISSNLRLWSALDIDPELGRCFFRHPCDPESKIFVFVDVPQLLKLLRNYFLDSGFKWRGKIIGKDILDHLLDASRTQPKLTPTLTNYHLDVQGLDRRTVRPAAQLLSNSVATAIASLGQRGQMGKLPWKEASECIRTINDWFDIFNSQVTDSNDPDQHAYGMDPSRQNNVLHQMTDFIYDLRVGSAKTIFSFQKGIMLNNAALPQLYTYLKKSFHSDEEPVDYLFTRRFNLDVTKQFFAHIISMGPTNDQPTASDFKFRLRWYILGRHPSTNAHGIPGGLEDPADEAEGGLLRSDDRILTNDFHSLYNKRKNEEDEAAEESTKKHKFDDVLDEDDLNVNRKTKRKTYRKKPFKVKLV